MQETFFTSSVMMGFFNFIKEIIFFWKKLWIGMNFPVLQEGMIHAGFNPSTNS